jgi:Cu2+-exporting ATPase
VFAGMINVGAPIRVRVSAVGERTLLSEIIRLVEAGERGRARFVALADRVARSYAPIVHATALLTFLGWYFLGGVPWDRALLIATSVLIITCPCALALAVPVVHVVASSRLLRAGVLVLRPTALERLASVDHVVLDKTGTVTIGRPELVGGSEDADALRVAAGIAASSRHPLAQALVRASPAVAVAEGTVEHPGGGLQHGNVRLGSARFCSIESSPDDGRSELWLTRPDCRPVRFTFSDRLRRDAVDVVHELTADGLEVELLSGDRRGAVQRVAAIIGVRWQAELSPAGKAQSVADLRNSGKRVLMIGDGLNDAPSLASASASMSPATAVEATQNVADAVFQGVSLMPVVEALRVARRADRLARQNLAIALLYNLVAVPLAIFGYVTPLIAALAMSCSSLLVIGNALRLGTFRQPKSTAETR